MHSKMDFIVLSKTDWKLTAQLFAQLVIKTIVKLLGLIHDSDSPNISTYVLYEYLNII